MCVCVRGGIDAGGGKRGGRSSLSVKRHQESKASTRGCCVFSSVSLFFFSFFSFSFSFWPMAVLLLGGLILDGKGAPCRAKALCSLPLKINHATALHFSFSFMFTEVLLLLRFLLFVIIYCMYTYSRETTEKRRLTHTQVDSDGFFPKIVIYLSSFPSFLFSFCLIRWGCGAALVHALLFFLFMLLVC